MNVKNDTETKGTEDKMETTLNAKADAVRWNKVATHCCVCGLALVDATSIEFGIGPVCRRKYNYEDAYQIGAVAGNEVSLFLAEQNFPYEVACKVDDAVQANDSRKAANALVYYASAEQGEAAILAAHALRLLGYTALADRIQDRLLALKIDRTAHGVFIKTAYNPAFISALKAKYVAQRWDGQNKVWTLPDTQEAFEHLDNVLRQVYAGQWAVGPNGPFKV